MANKNRFFNIILKSLNILILFILLNSCGGSANGINGTNNIDPHKKLMDGKMKDEQATCPNCKEGSRFLYRVSTNKDNNIILICEECNALWINPNNIGWSGATSDKLLKLKFGVDDSEVLFEEKSSGWATSKEIETSEWNQIARDNELLVK